MSAARVGTHSVAMADWGASSVALALGHHVPKGGHGLRARLPGGSGTFPDTLACYKLDCVGRSLAHLSKLLDDLTSRGIKFKTVSDGLDTSGSIGRLVLHMLAAVAQFERDLIVERTRAGLATAKKSGQRFGAR